MRIVTAAALAVMTLLCAPAGAGSEPQAFGVAAAPAERPADYVGFGIQLFSTLTAANPGKNVLVSPASAGLALSMAYDGAAGQTAIEMAQALGSGSTPDEVDAANGRLLASLLDQHDVTLEIANSVWLDAKRRTPLPSYIDRVERTYRARVTQLDFSDPGSPRKINAWVSSATHGKIDAIVDEIPKDMVMYLVNATYFKGTWASKFDPSLTRSKPFVLAGGTTASLPRMDKSADFDYLETPGLQAVRLPYVGDRFSMEIFLPRTTMGLTDFERTLSSDRWNEWQAEFSDRKGELELPRFTLAWSATLNDALKAMGVKRAFDPFGADFSAMYPPGPNASISEVVQKTYLKVDEHGSEAAAATRVGIAVASVVMPGPPPFRMIVDHPFFCAIVDRRTSAALFIAGVFDPRS